MLAVSSEVLDQTIREDLRWQRSPWPRSLRNAKSSEEGDEVIDVEKGTRDFEYQHNDKPFKFWEPTVANIPLMHLSIRLHNAQTIAYRVRHNGSSKTDECLALPHNTQQKFPSVSCTHAELFDDCMRLGQNVREVIVSLTQSVSAYIIRRHSRRYRIKDDSRRTTGLRSIFSYALYTIAVRNAQFPTNVAAAVAKAPYHKVPTPRSLILSRRSFNPATPP